MSRKFFFCRHAPIWHGDNLSNDGTLGLDRLKKMLGNYSFVATHAWSSTAKRCKLTANLLAPGIPVQVEPVLHDFGNFETLKWFADDFLAPILAADLPEDAHTVVATHDCIATVMAWRMIENNGGTVDWNLTELDALDMGCGFLVEGAKYTYLASPR